MRKNQSTQIDFDKVINLPDIQGFSESVKREFKLQKEGITVVFDKGRSFKKVV